MPYGAYLSIVSGIVILIFIGWESFHPWSTQGFITSYFGVPYAFIAFFVWKIVKNTKFVDPKKADIWTGKAEVDEECKIWEERDEKAMEKKSAKLLSRLWNKLW
jgi:amino acid transporter